MSLRHWPLVRRFTDLRFLLFFVTTQCNAQCATCFFWKELNTAKGPSLEQVERLASTMPSFRTLVIGGGEPSLRTDLPEIVHLFCRHNSIREATVPTNGLLPARIEDLARRTLAENPGLFVSFNVSLDGLAATHDRIRGVPGNFQRATETLTRLQGLRRQYPRFAVQVNTVISPENYTEVVPLAEELWQSLELDGHFFEVIRGEPRSMDVDGVPGPALAEVYRRVVDIQARYLRRARQRQNPLSRAASEVLELGRLLWQYRIQYRRYVRGALWPVRCPAGRTIGVVEPDGTLKACELRQRVASLDQDAWGFGAWYGRDMAREVRGIRHEHCDCTHVCFLGSGRDHSLRATFIQVPWLWLQYRRGKEWL